MSGGEAVRWLAGHPSVELVGVISRSREGEPLEGTQPHLARTGLSLGTDIPSADAAFLALPHGQAAAIVPALLAAGSAVIDLGPDFRLRDPGDYPTLVRLRAPRTRAPRRGRSTGCPSCIGPNWRRWVRPCGPLVGAPGCYPTAALLALAPLVRVGLLGDVVVDAKSGVSGAGREPGPSSPSPRSTRTCAPTASTATATRPRSSRSWPPSPWIPAPTPPVPSTSCPTSCPMTRGILATCHVRPDRAVDQAELDELYRAAYADEPFVAVVGEPPATKHVLASNEARIYVKPRSRAAAASWCSAPWTTWPRAPPARRVQAFNVLYGLDERTGLARLPVAP